MEASDYAIERTTADGIAIVRLIDRKHATEVAVVPSIGNNAYEMKVNGKNVFWSPYKTLTDLKAKPTLQGNPLLAPWANRIDSTAYWANGKKYMLNESLGNLRMDGFSDSLVECVFELDGPYRARMEPSRITVFRDRVMRASRRDKAVTACCTCSAP